MLRSVPSPKVAFLRRVHSMSSAHVQQWSEFLRTKCYLTGEYLLCVPLHEPNRNDQNQNHYCGVQTPVLLTPTVVLAVNLSLCGPVENIDGEVYNYVYSFYEVVTMKSQSSWVEIFNIK
jgi:hypothetical protein